MASRELWDCTMESKDPDIKALYSAGFTEYQVIAINNLIIKYLNFYNKHISEALYGKK